MHGVIAVPEQRVELAFNLRSFSKSTEPALLQTTLAPLGACRNRGGFLLASL